MKKYIVKNTLGRMVYVSRFMFKAGEEREVDEATKRTVTCNKGIKVIKVVEPVAATAEPVAEPVPQDEEKEEVFTCEKCGKVYKSEGAFEKHVKKCEAGE